MIFKLILPHKKSKMIKKKNCSNITNYILYSFGDNPMKLSTQSKQLIEGYDSLEPVYHFPAFCTNWFLSLSLW